jgi:hypothetical protein
MIAEIVARLKLAAGELTSVDAAEELEAISKGVAPQHGSCFVLPFREIAQPNERMNTELLQHVSTEVLIAFVVRHHGSAKGGKRVEDFDRFKLSIETAVAGWQVDPSWEPMELVAGHAGVLGNGATAYVQTWRTSRFLQAEVS